MRGTPPTPPSTLARKIMEMLRRRRPDLHETVEELSRNREGRSLIAEAFSAAYETYVKTAQLEEAYEAFIETIESSIDSSLEE
ncbi:MAG: hypothetical protein ACP5HK_02450 [Acidilobus sp.]